jgi:hypothetical protein
LAARGSGEVCDLVERVERAAIGVGGLGVDPRLDDGVKAGEHEADERATAEPGPLGKHDRHEDHRNDRERHKRRVGPDVAAAANDRRRGERSRQHSGEIDRTEQADGEIGETFNAGSQRRHDAHQAVAADQHQHGQQQRGNGGKGGGHTANRRWLMVSAMVSHHRPARDADARPNRFDKMRARLENRHIDLASDCI